MKIAKTENIIQKIKRYEKYEESFNNRIKALIAEKIEAKKAEIISKKKNDIMKAKCIDDQIKFREFEAKHNDFLMKTLNPKFLIKYYLKKEDDTMEAKA